MPSEYNVSRLEDVNGDFALILAKKLENQIQLALSGAVSGSTTTDFSGNVNITVSINAGAIKSTHIADDAVKAEHINDGETLPVDISGNAATATKATKDGNGKVIANEYATKDEVRTGYVAASEKGAANGVATLDENGTVPSSQLPSYVDDSIEGYLYNGKFYSDSGHTKEVAAESGKIYVDLSTNKAYRWSGSQYTEISASLALGDNSSTAYRGDRGKAAYDHSQKKSGNPHNVTLGDLGVEATAAELNVLDGITVTVTEINALDNITGNVQEQLNAKATPSNVEAAISTEVTNRNKAIEDAIKALDSNKISTDGTNLQVKVTLTDGKVTAVNITDNTASKTALDTEVSERKSADKALDDRVKSLETESKTQSEEVTAHEINHDNPHAVNKVQLNIPYLGNCLYDPDTHTLKMCGVSFSSKGSPIISDDPQVGDALYIDGDGNKTFFKGGDLLKGCSIPAGLTPVGVVIKRVADDVLIHYYRCSQDLKFASVWMWELTNIPLDGSNHTITFCQRTNADKNITIGSFTYAATTLSDFCSQLNDWLIANPGGTAAGAGWNYNWHCKYMENYNGVLSCIVIADTMSDYLQYNSIVVSGCSCSQNMAASLPAIGENPGFQRMGGSGGVRCGANAARLIEWYSSNPGSTATLTSDVTPSTGSVVVSRTQFNEDAHCAPLRAVYKTFEEYIKKCVMLKWPSFNKGMATAYGKAKEWTYAIGNRTHTNKGGTSGIATFPAAHFATSLNFNSVGLRAGDWRMMGIEDTYEMISKMTCGLSGHTTFDGFDIVNKTLSAMGGSTVDLTNSRWLAVRYGNNYAWIFHYNGHFSYNAFSYARRVSAVALLTL